MRSASTVGLLAVCLLVSCAPALAQNAANNTGDSTEDGIVLDLDNPEQLQATLNWAIGASAGPELAMQARKVRALPLSNCIACTH